ncbi:MAG: hypothetical protein V3R81_15250 [Gammaproteobacteria bacterium]
MTYRLFWLYAAIVIWFAFLGAIIDGTTAFVGSDTVNSITSYQMDKVASGSGFINLIRKVGDFSGAVASTVTFGLGFVVNAMTFNYSYLQGSAEIIRWVLIVIFGGPLLLSVAGDAMGALRRNV